MIDEEQLVTTIERHERVARCELAQLSRVPRAVLAALPHDVAIEHRAVPLDVDDDGYLRLVMADPTDTMAIEEISFFTGPPHSGQAASGGASMRWSCSVRLPQL